MPRPILPNPGDTPWSTILNAGINSVSDAVDVEVAVRPVSEGVVSSGATAYTDTMVAAAEARAEVEIDAAVSSFTNVYRDDAAGGSISIAGTTLVDNTVDPPTVTPGYVGVNLILADNVTLTVTGVDPSKRTEFLIQVQQASSATGPYALTLGAPFVAPNLNDPITAAPWDLTKLASPNPSEVEVLQSRSLGDGLLRLSNTRVRYGTVLPPSSNPPDIAVAPVATSGDGSVTLTWTVPYDGGSSITGYVATLSGGVSPIVISTSVPSGTLTPSSVDFTSGVVNDTTYTGTVSFSNAVGVGGTSLASNTTTPTGGVAPVGLKEPIKGLISRGSGPPTTGSGASEVLTYPDVDTYIKVFQAQDLSPSAGVFNMAPVTAEIARAKKLGARFCLRVFTGGASIGGYHPAPPPPTNRKWSASGAANTGDPEWAKALGAAPGTPQLTVWDEGIPASEDSGRTGSGGPGTATAANNKIAYTEYFCSRYWTLDYQNNFFLPFIQALSNVVDNEPVVGEVDICLGATIFNEAMLKHVAGIENHSGVAATGAPITYTDAAGATQNFTVYAGWPSGDECNNHNNREFLRSLKDSAAKTGEPDWTFGNNDDAMWMTDFASPRGDGAFKALFAMVKATFAHTRYMFSYNPYNTINAGGYNWATNTGTPTNPGGSLANTRMKAVMDWMIGSTGGTTDSGLGTQAILFQKSFSTGVGFTYDEMDTDGNPAGVQSVVAGDGEASYIAAVGNLDGTTPKHHFFRYELNSGSSYDSGNARTGGPLGTGYNGRAKSNPTVDPTRPGYDGTFPPAGLLVKWDGTGATSSTIPDQSGGTNNGLPYNGSTAGWGATPTTDLGPDLTPRLIFSRASQQQVRLVTTGSALDISEFTIAGWGKITEASTTQDCWRVLDKAGCFWLTVRAPSDGTNPWGLRVGIKTTDSTHPDWETAPTWVLNSAANLVVQNVDFHVALTYKAGTARLYFNGVKVAERTDISGNLLAGTEAHHNYLVMGGRYSPDDPGGTPPVAGGGDVTIQDWWNGPLNVRLFGSQLSDAEIVSLATVVTPPSVSTFRTLYPGGGGQSSLDVSPFHVAWTATGTDTGGLRLSTDGLRTSFVHLQGLDVQAKQVDGVQWSRVSGTSDWLWISNGQSGTSGGGLWFCSGANTTTPTKWVQLDGTNSNPTLRFNGGNSADAAAPTGSYPRHYGRILAIDEVSHAGFTLIYCASTSGCYRVRMNNSTKAVANGDIQLIAGTSGKYVRCLQPAHWVGNTGGGDRSKLWIANYDARTGAAENLLLCSNANATAGTALTTAVVTNAPTNVEAMYYIASASTGVPTLVCVAKGKVVLCTNTTAAAGSQTFTNVTKNTAEWYTACLILEISGNYVLITGVNNRTGTRVNGVSGTVFGERGTWVKTATTPAPTWTILDATNVSDKLIDSTGALQTFTGSGGNTLGISSQGTIDQYGWSPDSPLVVYAAAPGNTYWSQDAGLTWNPVNVFGSTGQNPSGVAGVAGDPSNAGYGAATSGDSPIIITKNGWSTSVAPNSSKPDIEAVWYDPITGELFAAGTTVWGSTRAVLWATPLPVSSEGMGRFTSYGVPVAGKDVLAGCTGYTAGGKRVTLVALAGSAGCYTTVDAGTKATTVTWTAVGAGPFKTAASGGQIIWSGPGSCFYIYDRGVGVYRVPVTSATGATGAAVLIFSQGAGGTPQNSTGYIAMDYATANRLWIACAAGLFYVPSANTAAATTGHGTGVLAAFGAHATNFPGETPGPIAKLASSLFVATVGVAGGNVVYPLNGSNGCRGLKVTPPATPENTWTVTTHYVDKADGGFARTAQQPMNIAVDGDGSTVYMMFAGSGGGALKTV